MNNIYEISKEFFDVVEELENNGGEITPELEQQLSFVSETFEKKCIDYGWVIKYKSAEVDIIDNEIKRLQNLKKSRQKAVDTIKQRLESFMKVFDKRKVESPTLTLSLRKSSSVLIEDESLLPKKYIKKKVTYAPDKTEIGKVLKRGEQVKGALLMENENLQLK